MFEFKWIKTEGILMWSELLFVNKSDGTEIEVLLIDTRGISLCADQNEIEIDKVIFYFTEYCSTLLSSFVILNAKKQFT